MKKRTKSLAVALVAALALFAVATAQADIGRMPSDFIYSHVATGTDDNYTVHDDPLLVVSRNGPLVAATPKVWFGSPTMETVAAPGAMLGPVVARASDNDLTGNPAYHGRTSAGGSLAILMATTGDREWTAVLRYG